MRYFLIVYDKGVGLQRVQEFLEDERACALRARFEVEANDHVPGREVVVVGSPSRAALERTHSRYFKTVSELASAT